MKNEAKDDSLNAEAKDDWAQRKEMEALFAAEEGLSKKVSAREIVLAGVIASTPEGLLVDIGEKREGFVPISDFVFAPKKPAKAAKVSPSRKSSGQGIQGDAASLANVPKAGERIPVIYVGRRPDGTSLLSHRKAKAELSWGEIFKSFQEKKRVHGKVESLIKGGFIVDISGVSAFMPASLSDLRPVFNGEGMIGKTVHCKIMELNAADRKLIVSRRAVLEEELDLRRAKVFSEIEPGQIRFGRISKTSSEGLIVDVGGLRGLVRSGDIAWGEIRTPLYKRGDKLRVKVLSKSIPEIKEGKASEFVVYFGIKQMLPNPVEILKKKYAPGMIVSGVVLHLDAAGVLLNVLSVKGGKERGPRASSQEKKMAAPISAFCPASQLDADSPLKEKDEVSALIIGIDPKNFHILVSIRKFNDKRDQARVAQYLKAPPPLTLGDIFSSEE